MTDRATGGAQQSETLCPGVCENARKKKERKQDAGKVGLGGMAGALWKLVISR